MADATLHEPCQFLEKLVDAFQTNADIYVFDDYQRHLHESKQLKHKEHDATRDQLRALSRQLELARGKARRPSTGPSEQDHAVLMEKLDHQKFSLAKDIKEQTHERLALETQLRELREERTVVDTLGGGAGATSGSTALALWIYRNIGVELLSDKMGSYSRVQVTSGSNDTRTYEIAAMSHYQLADLIWRQNS